jgi:glycogenin glucosyltransferase
MAFFPSPEIWPFPVPLAAARDVPHGFGWLPTINAGTLLFQPKGGAFEDMMRKAGALRNGTVFAELRLLEGG